MEWSEDTVVKLRALWAQGCSTAEIGRRIGFSKNAVVGKAHRLNLEARPSPIRCKSERTVRRRQPPRAQGSTLPSLAVPHASMPSVEPPRLAMRIEPPRLAMRTEISAERIAPTLRAVPTAKPGGRITPCCWPIGEPGTRSFRFCDDASMSGKPYCEQHAALAYVKSRDRREDAA